MEWVLCLRRKLIMTIATSILRRKEVQARTGLSRSSIYNLMKADITPFPKQIRMSPRTVGWLETDIDAYIQARVTESQGNMKDGA